MTKFGIHRRSHHPTSRRMYMTRVMRVSMSVCLKQGRLPDPSKFPCFSYASASFSRRSRSTTFRPQPIRFSRKGKLRQFSKFGLTLWARCPGTSVSVLQSLGKLRLFNFSNFLRLAGLETNLPLVLVRVAKSPPALLLREVSWYQ